SAILNASSPSPATSTSYPTKRRLISTNRATSGSSSTTRIVSSTFSPPSTIVGRLAEGVEGCQQISDGRGELKQTWGASMSGPGAAQGFASEAIAGEIWRRYF